MIEKIVLVAIGSGVGGVLRYSVSLLSRSTPSIFPYWTFTVNVLGGLLIGLLAAILPTDSERTRLLFITGFCGGFTTFSAFSLETLELFQQGAHGWAFLNILLSIVCAVGGCWLGYLIGENI